MCEYMLICFRCVQLFVTLRTVAHQAPLSMGFSRQEYWSGLPSPSPGDLPNPGIKPTSLTRPALAGRFFITSGKPKYISIHIYFIYFIYTSSLVESLNTYSSTIKRKALHNMKRFKLLIRKTQFFLKIGAIESQ